MTKTVCYLQGGPCDLQKIVFAGEPRREIYMAYMEQPLVAIGDNWADAARAVICKKLVYREVGGYMFQGMHITTYVYAGPLPEIVTA